MEQQEQQQRENVWKISICWWTEMDPLLSFMYDLREMAAAWSTSQSSEFELACIASCPSWRSCLFCRMHSPNWLITENVTSSCKAKGAIDCWIISNKLLRTNHNCCCCHCREKFKPASVQHGIASRLSRHIWFQTDNKDSYSLSSKTTCKQLSFRPLLFHLGYFILVVFEYMLMKVL